MRNEDVLIRFRKCIRELNDINQNNLDEYDLDITDEIDRLDLVLCDLTDRVLDDVT